MLSSKRCSFSRPGEYAPESAWENYGVVVLQMLRACLHQQAVKSKSDQPRLRGIGDYMLAAVVC